MSDSPLTSLKPTLMAIEAASVRAPNLPMAVALQEASDLADYVGADAVRAKLLGIGLEAGVLDGFSPAIAAAREAQSQWTVLREAGSSEAKKARIEDALALRKEIAAACRWNLRADRAALGAVSAVMDGEGNEDLIQDLNDLAELVDRKRSAFAADRTFDAEAQANQARSLAAELTALTSAERNEMTSQDAKDLRDRAYTHLDDLRRVIREAGRYAFRNDPEAFSPFSSDYLRRRRARAAKDAAETDSAAETEGEGDEE